MTRDFAHNADLLVLGCVSTKRSKASPARDLYVSPLWHRRRAYAERSGRPWVIFSALHAILDPDEVIAPYDVNLKAVAPADRAALGRRAARQIEERLGALSGRVVEIHAGAAYVAALAPELRRRGVTVVWPTEGLRMGEQLHWYDTDRAPAPQVSTVPAGGPVGMSPLGVVNLVSRERIGPFTYRWPVDEESFVDGMDLVVDAGGVRFRVRHGWGRRFAYGRDRARTVTWVNSQPQVEGAGADDYDESGGLISLLRIEGGRMVDHGDELPAGYEGFALVRAADEIVAPYSRRKLAVKLHEDDLQGWVRHALLRVLSRRATPPAGAKAETPSRPRLQAPPSPNQHAVAEALIAFGDANPMDNAKGEAVFTPHPEANELVKHDPFAFLLAVIFDQGILAERAWAAPFHLRKRLGHLDPARVASEPGQVAAAIAEPPMLHRYVNTMPGWVCAAATQVVTQYGGQAARIWEDRPTAVQLQARFDAFKGVGQKKAAMAVAILERDLHVPIEHLSGNDVAFDVHIRRVFLRTGLVEHDDLDEVLDVGRRLSPDQPARLDLPAWVIGRTWCRPGVPNCPDCPLVSVCPRFVDRGAGVFGA